MMGFFGRGKSGPSFLGSQNFPVSVGGTLTETTLASFIIPANAMGPNGILRVYAKFGITNSANTKTYFVRFGGTQIWTQNSTTQNYYNAIVHIFNRNSTASQIGGGSYSGGVGGSAVAQETAVIDTTSDTTLSITGQTTLETGFTPTAANMSGNGTTITVIHTNHGLNTGEYVKAAGSSTSGYNIQPAQITRIDANTFTYAGTGTGTPATAPTIQRYSVITLESAYVELLK